MLATLATVKSRLAILPTDLTYDSLLTSAIKAISTRFDRETNRTLARTVGFIQEFDADATDLVLACYPLESVSRFEVKSSEAAGWLEQTATDFIIRNNCVISLGSPLRAPNSASSIARVTYTGGYVLPGTTSAPGQTPLPDDLEQAAVEQLAYWFQKKEHLGLRIYWPSGDAYRQFVELDLLAGVTATLTRYRRWTL